MAKKIELLHTTYDESGNIESQEVVHPLTSPDCVIMENGETLADVMGDGIATPTLTHEGTSFKVGVGDSNIEVVDGDVAGMTLKGQSYQNILPKPTTLIMETDEQEFKINDKIDSNIIIDDNIAEIATVKGKTIVNTVQEESGNEYTVLGEDLSGQSIVTTNKPEGNIKGVTLQGQTLVNTIQKPCKDDYVVLGAEDGIEISAETGGHGTIEDTVQGGLNGAVLEGMTLVNTISNTYDSCHLSVSQEVSMSSEDTTWDSETYRIKAITFTKNMLPNITYLIKLKVTELTGTDKLGSYVVDMDGNMTYSIANGVLGENNFIYTPTVEIQKIAFYLDDIAGKTATIKEPMVIEYQEGMENWDIPYFEGMKSVQMPVLTTTGKNLFDGEMVQGYIGDSTGNLNAGSTAGISSANFTPVKPNTTYRLSLSDNPAKGTILFYFYDKHKNYVGRTLDPTTVFTTGNNVAYVKFRIYKIDSVFLDDYKTVQFQIEESSTATSYEPYQSSTVTTSEKVELRGIGDVKDELDLQTGKLTQRIGEYTELSNSQCAITSLYQLDGHTTFSFGDWTHKLKNAGSIFSNKLPYPLQGEGVYFDGWGLYLRIKNNKLTTLDSNGLKEWLIKEDFIIVFPMKTETIKTIDLQVTDQDGNTIPHIQTQPTITHIIASSDYLIPTVTIDNNLAYDTIIKPSTLYTVRFKHDTVNADNPLTVDLGGTVQEVTSTEFTITTPDTLTHNQLVFSGKNNVVSEVQVIEGDVTNIEYPFFEGMNDVKSPKMIARGKNMFNFENGRQMNGLTFSNNGANNYIVSGTCTGDNKDFYAVAKDKNNGTFTRLNSLPIGTTITVSKSSSVGKQVYLSITQKDGSPTKYTQTYTTTNNDGVINCFIRFMKGDTFNNDQLNLQIEIGSTATSYEPYRCVEVQQDVDSIPLTSDMFEQGNITGGKIVGMSYQQLSHNTETIRVKSKTLVPIKPNGKYIIQNLNKTNNRLWGWQYDKNGGYLSSIGNTDEKEMFQFDSKAHYVTFVLCNQDDTAITPSNLDSLNLILQEVPQEIVLRGIGDVKDELDLTKGEYIQRIGEITFKGTENVYVWTNSVYDNDEYVPCYFVMHELDSKYPLQIANGKVFLQEIDDVNDDKHFAICNDFCYDNTLIKDDYKECFMVINAEPNYVSFKIKKSRLNTVDEQGIKDLFKQKYNSGNPITFQFALATPIIHKVNLTNTKVIPSYATETHYETITPSDSLIPNITIPSSLNYDVTIKPSTEYTIRANTSDNLTVDLGGTTGTLSNGKVTLTTPATLTHNEVKFSGTGKVKELMVVEGNEIKDNVPFFNGMKDVQMGGIKLVNIARGATCSSLVTANTNKTQFTYTGDGTNWGKITFDKSLLKPNTKYTIKMNVISNCSSIKVQLGHAGWNYYNINNNVTGIISGTIISPPTVKCELPSSDANYFDDSFCIYFRNADSGQQTVIQNPMIIEGDWTHLDEIPYIESEMIIDQPIIRSQGKNLFDISRGINYTWYSEYTINGDGSVSVMPTLVGGVAYVQSEFFFLEVGKTYTVSWNASGNAHASFVWLAGTTNSPYGTSNTFTVVEGKNKLTLAMYVDTSSLENVATFKPQIEEGSTATSYEPYKHQTLYSNRVIGYEEGVHYGYIDGVKYTNANYNSVMADVEGLSIACVTNGSSNFTFWDKDGVFISGKGQLDTALSSTDKNGFITVPTNAKYMKFASSCATGSSTDYTKATVTGDLPLRSLPNGVCDTLNLVTGEYVQNIKEVVIDGSEDWFIQEDNTKTEKTIYCRCTSFPDNLPLPSDWDNNAYNVNLNCDNLTVYSSDHMWKNEVEGISRVLSSRYLRIRLNKNKLDTPDLAGFKQYLSQNPITVQYQLEIPIVRKLGFTTKGNYREQILDGSEGWRSEAVADSERIRMVKTTSPLTNTINSSPIFTDGYYVRLAGVETDKSYEYIYYSGTSMYINIKQKNVETLDTIGCTQWLSQNPIKVGYITSAQSSESYSNIHKPIFFNNVDVLFLPHNLYIQPQLTLQARTRNSYVMDMMKANTKYSIKLLDYSGNMTIDETSYTLANNRTFVSPSTLTNKELIISGQWYEPMIIEGDVTGKNLPYFKGILSSYHDVDEIEVYSVSKNLFDIKGSVNEQYDFMYSVTIKGGKNYIKDNVIYCVDDSQNNYGSGQKIKCKPNTKYCISFHSENLARVGIHLPNKANVALGLESTSSYTTPNDCYEFLITFYRNGGENNGTHIIRNLQIEESSTSTSYIPHAHNTTLIEMPTRLETVKVVRPKLEIGGIEENGQNSSTYLNGVRTRDFIPVKPNMLVSISNNGANQMANWWLYDINKNFIKKIQHDNSFDSSTLTIPENTYFVRIHRTQSNIDNLILTLKEYKPIQLNSLPNGVYDEIIMKPNSNKAQLVQRVDKVVLDGSENISVDSTVMTSDYTLNEISTYFRVNPTSFTLQKAPSSYSGQPNMLCDSLVVTSRQESQQTISNSICIYNDGFGMRPKNDVNNSLSLQTHLQQNPITVYYELATPIIHEIQLKGYPHVYENGTVTLNTDIPHQTLVSYNVNQEQLISNQNETIIRHDQQIDDLYYYIEMYLEEIYQMELFRMKLELSL